MCADCWGTKAFHLQSSCTMNVLFPRWHPILSFVGEEHADHLWVPWMHSDHSLYYHLQLLLVSMMGTDSAVPIWEREGNRKRVHLIWRFHRNLKSRNRPETNGEYVEVAGFVVDGFESNSSFRVRNCQNVHSQYKFKWYKGAHMQWIHTLESSHSMKHWYTSESTNAGTVEIRAKNDSNFFCRLAMNEVSNRFSIWGGGMGATKSPGKMINNNPRSHLKSLYLRETV